MEQFSENPFILSDNILIKFKFQDRPTDDLKWAEVLPFHRELDDCVKLAEQSPGSFSHLNVVAVGQAWRGGWGAQLSLSTSLGLLQRQ